MRIAFIAALVSVAAHGCAEPACEQGSYEVAGTCVPGLSPSCGAGTLEQDGICVAVDGEEIQCGPGTHALRGECISDADAPGNGSRYVELVFTKPDTVGELVNPVIADALASGDMVVLNSALNPREGSLRVYGSGSGSVDENGIFAFDPAWAYAVDATPGPEGFTTEPFTWSIVGLTD